MELKKFPQPSSTVIEYEDKRYYFIGYLMPDENMIIRARPITSWIRQHGLIGPNNEVYIPKYEEGK